MQNYIEDFSLSEGIWEDSSIFLCVFSDSNPLTEADYKLSYHKTHFFHRFMVFFCRRIFRGRY